MYNKTPESKAVALSPHKYCSSCLMGPSNAAVLVNKPPHTLHTLGETTSEAELELMFQMVEQAFW